LCDSASSNSPVASDSDLTGSAKATAFLALSEDLIGVG
jgi:hypothetical protein